MNSPANGIRTYHGNKTFGGQGCPSLELISSISITFCTFISCIVVSNNFLICSDVQTNKFHWTGVF